MKPVCPSEDRLKSLIMEAFDELSAPDPAHMQRIATTLSRKMCKQRKPRQSWLFWILLGGSVTAAAWWTGEQLFPNVASLPLQPVQTETIKQSIDLGNKITKPPIANKKPTQQQRLNKSPIIDQREQY